MSARPVWSESRTVPGHHTARIIPHLGDLPRPLHFAEVQAYTPGAPCKWTLYVGGDPERGTWTRPSPAAWSGYAPTLEQAKAAAEQVIRDMGWFMTSERP